MITKMDKRVAGVVALLGLAFASVSRPALAQDGSSWFDDGSGNDQPPAPQSAPPMPTDAPRPPGLNGAPTSPGPQAPGPQALGEEGPAEADNVPETDPRAITEFRPTLDPYGTWVDDEKYGTVWVPNRDAVGDDFAPYVSAGHWALTDDGDWIWQSDYPFGGVVFHYGRWVWVPGTGWAWVAGRRYANAWVTWRVSTDDYGYIGWAPMPPAWGWYGGSAVSLWWYPPTAYVFCPTRYAFSYRVNSYIVHDRYVIHDVANHTRNYSDGRAQHLAAQPRVLPANSVAPRGPSLQSARIPGSAAPSSRVPMRSAYAGPRPQNLSSAGRSPTFNQRNFSSGARPLSPSTYPAGTSYRAPSANPNYANPSMYARPRQSYSAPSGGYRNAPSAAPRSYALPSAGATRYSAPATTYHAPSTYRAPPSFNSSSYRSAPSFHSAPSYHSAPSFNSSPVHSAPSFHSSPSGGGRSFSGGRR